MDSPIVFLMGPTASGKTDLALELCRRLPMEVISVDSAMVYRGMDIGTAKPSKELLDEVPHRLINICDPAECYSAARFAEDARREIESIHIAGGVPLLVGGTGLYFRALEQGLSEMPAADPEIRLRIETEAREKGWVAMHDKLAAVDPAAADRIHPNDPQRLQRALEVYELTGRAISEFHDLPSQSLEHPVIKIIVAPKDRQVLHDRISSRFENMLQEGLVEEVQTLYEREDLGPDLPAMRLVGYRQVWEYLAGTLDYEQMKAHAIAATRQLAKRQLTWLRREENATWFDSLAGDLTDSVYNYLIKKEKKSIKL